MSWQPPLVLERRLPNGIRLLMVERRELPIVYVRFIVKRGAADAQPGLANYAAAMAFRASSKPDGCLWVDQDAFGVDFTGITHGAFGSNLSDEPFEDTCRRLRAPDFSPDQLAIERRLWVDGVRDVLDTDEQRIELRESAVLYPAGHPYHEPPLAQEPAFRADNALLSQGFFAAQVRPDQLVVVAVGDLAHESFVDSVRNACGSWTGQAEPRAPWPGVAPPAAAPPDLVLIDNPKGEESLIRFAARAASWDNEDYPALVILDSVLGGFFTSRLNLNLREHNLYTYGASSRLWQTRDGSKLEARVVVPADDTVDSVRQMQVEVERMRSQPLRPEELASHKRAATRRVPLMSLTLQGTLGAVSLLGIYDRPADTYSHLVERLSGVSAADVLRVARKYLGPERLHWFVLGDARRFRRGLSSLGFRDVQLVPASVAYAATPSSVSLKQPKQTGSP